MYRFNNDYHNGAHPAILAALSATNDTAYCGYGLDEECEKATAMLRRAMNAPDADIHYLVGGTQTNAVMIHAALRPWEGVISAESGHINVHECGAVEACGVKILTLPTADGKLTASQVEDVAVGYEISTVPEHVTVPRMVYISSPTEYGTLYSKAELEALSDVCRKHGLYLFLDGARLAYGLGADGADTVLADYPRLCDAFYIGGTKCGALFGEALVIFNPALKPHFRNMIKQSGAMLAKGWLLGLQFSVLFTDDLYLRIGKEAVRYAILIRDAFEKAGCPLYMKNPTNQVFVILTKAQQEKLAKDFIFEYENPVDENSDCVRFCTTWSTRKEEIDALLKAIQSL